MRGKLSTGSIEENIFYTLRRGTFIQNNRKLFMDYIFRCVAFSTTYKQTHLSEDIHLH